MIPILSKTKEVVRDKVEMPRKKVVEGKKML